MARIKSISERQFNYVPQTSLDAAPVLSVEQLELLDWLQEMYLHLPLSHTPHICIDNAYLY